MIYLMYHIAAAALLTVMVCKYVFLVYTQGWHALPDAIGNFPAGFMLGIWICDLADDLREGE